ncbi:enoyl-CoA hydratase/isomerase family protein [Janibacter melonis]|uniref:enoyl-CoA hydratase/isomerase family protein n=1 Tax=Janibacter melonis TaxID=262209 RepID=UPI0017489ACE|nr:enoyl-CoA hydratase-related protein [Janibacter melonis]
MTSATTPLIRLERHDDGVVEVVLDRPEAMNAVSTAMATALREAGKELRDDTSVRTVVLSSSHPKAFCVGADLKERNSLSDDELRAQRPGNRVAYRALLDLPVPTVAAVGGFAMGGGCELALTCDLIVAGEGAVFALPEVSVGVIPGAGGTQLLARRVGWSRAADVVFTARRLDAQEAYRIGLADRVVQDARDGALELAAGIARHSPIGIRNAKAAMRVGLDLPLDEGLDVEDARWHDTAFSADRAEGVRAFAEKRAPRWPGLG